MYFDDCKDMDGLKREYMRLFKLHPNLDGETMTSINDEHARVFSRLQREQNDAAYRGEGKRSTECPGEFGGVLSMILPLDGVTVELCGSWLWISGDTRKHKDVLKAAGCLWSKSKQMWYWRHAEKGCTWSRGKQSMESIRLKYGSAYVKQAANPATV